MNDLLWIFECVKLFAFLVRQSKDKPPIFAHDFLEGRTNEINRS